MKRKTNKTKSIIGISLGAVLAFAGMPAINLPTILSSSADETIKSVYTTNTAVTLTNSSFENLIGGTYTIDDWEVLINSKDEGKQDIDSSTTSGALNITPNNYETNYTSQFKDLWLANWISNHTELTNLNNVRDALDAKLIAPENPLTHDITENISKNKRVLYINAGKIYGGYDDPTNLTETTREVYYNYSSNDFTLNPYSYYKLSVWVKTDGGKASISLGGDLEGEYFTDINAESTNPDSVYIYKKHDSASGLTTYFYKAEPLGPKDYVEGEKTYTYHVPGEGEDYWENGTVRITRNGTGDNSGWTQYSIYVSTAYSNNKSGKYTANFNLALGSKDSLSSGIVYFDDVKIEQIQYSAYLQAVKNENESLTPETNDISILNKRTETENGYQTISNFNSIGSDELYGTGWTVDPRTNGLDGVEIGLRNEEKLTNIYATFGDSTNKVLLVDNYSSSSINLTSTKAQIEPFNYYRVSIWSRSDYKNKNYTSASFTMKLNATLNDNTVSAKELTVKPYSSEYEKATPNSINNFWTESVLLVEACPIYSTDVWLTISIPKESSFMFDNFVIEKISSDEYSNSSDTKLSLTTSLPKDTITNGHFNLIDTNKSEYNKLYSANGWTKTITTTTDVYKYYENANENIYSKILNASSDISFGPADENNIYEILTYDLKDFHLVEDTTDTYAYRPYRYKFSSSDSASVRYIDLPQMITENSYVYDGFTFTRQDATTNTFTYTDSGITYTINFEGQTIEATEKIEIDKDVTFSFDEEKDAFVSDLYKGHEINKETLKDNKFQTGIVNGYNYDYTILNTYDSSYVNSKNVYENYLAIANSTTNSVDGLTVTYKSAKIALTASTYKLISLYAYLDGNFNGEITVNLLNSNNKLLATQKVNKKPLTPNENNWQAISFYVKNGLIAESVYLEIIYGSNDATTIGTALFKTATVKSSTKTKFTTLAETATADNIAANTSLVELGGESFTEVGESLGNGFYNSLTIGKSESSTGSVSILNTSEDKDTYASYIYEKATTPYVLVIKNNSGESTTIDPLKSYNLSSKSFYKFTIVAKAMNLEEGKEAKITFSNISESISVASDEFTTYTMYVATTDKTLSTKFAMELLNASGTIVIDNVALTKLEESTFKSAIEALTDEDSTTKAVDLRATTDEKTEDTEDPIEEESKTLEILFATLSSLLLVAAIVFALVFTRVNVLKGKGKKTRMKNKVKSSDNDERGFV